MVTIRVNRAALEWFEERQISFHNRFEQRLQPGDLLRFLEDTYVEPYVGIHAGNTICKLGFMSYSNSQLKIDLRIGRYCSIASNVQFPWYRHPIEHISTSVFTHDYHTDLVARFKRDHKPGYENFSFSRQRPPAIVENDVWIGANAAIMSGVTIGTGAVVAANSVVTRSVEPYEIVGGNPARRIKMRFPAEIVAGLSASEWWKYKFTDFDGLTISDPVSFLKEFEAVRGQLEPYNPDQIRLGDVLPLIPA